MLGNGISMPRKKSKGKCGGYHLAPQRWKAVWEALLSSNIASSKGRSPSLEGSTALLPIWAFWQTKDTLCHLPKPVPTAPPLTAQHSQRMP